MTGTVPCFNRGGPSARGSPADTREACRSTCCSVPAAMRAYSRRGPVTQREPKRPASAGRDRRVGAGDHVTGLATAGRPELPGLCVPTVYLPKIPSAQVGQLFGFGGGRMSWLLREGPLA